MLAGCSVRTRICLWEQQNQGKLRPPINQEAGDLSVPVPNQCFHTGELSVTRQGQEATE